MTTYKPPPHARIVYRRELDDPHGLTGVRERGDENVIYCGAKRPQLCLRWGDHGFFLSRPGDGEVRVRLEGVSLDRGEELRIQHGDTIKIGGEKHTFVDVRSSSSESLTFDGGWCRWHPHATLRIERGRRVESVDIGPEGVCLSRSGRTKHHPYRKAWLRFYWHPTGKEVLLIVEPGDAPSRRRVARAGDVEQNEDATITLVEAKVRKWELRATRDGRSRGKWMDE